MNFLPRERQVSTTAQSEVTVELSSWIVLSMTDSSMMCFTSFFSRVSNFSFCSRLAELLDSDMEEVDDVDELGIVKL